MIAQCNISKMFPLLLFWLFVPAAMSMCNCQTRTSTIVCQGETAHDSVTVLGCYFKAKEIVLYSDVIIPDCNAWQNEIRKISIKSSKLCSCLPKAVECVVPTSAASSMTSGTKAGIGLGSIAFMVLVGLIIYCLIRKQHNANAPLGFANPAYNPDDGIQLIPLRHRGQQQPQQPKQPPRNADQVEPGDKENDNVPENAEANGPEDDGSRENDEERTEGRSRYNLRDRENAKIFKKF